MRALWTVFFCVLLAAGSCSDETPDVALEILAGPGISGSVDSPTDTPVTTNPDNLDLKDAVIITVGITDAADPNMADLLGVVSGPDPAYQSPAPNVALFLQDIGIRSVRNDAYLDDRLDMERMFSCPDGDSYPSWNCDPEDADHFDWDISDTQFNAWMGEHYFEPFFRLGGEAVSLHDLHDFKGPGTEEEQGNWIEAAKQVLDRYHTWQNEDGNLDYVDIWTEWPGEDYWSHGETAFVEFWARAFEELSESAPELRFGGPGFSTAASRDVRTGKGGAAVAFLTHLHQEDLRPDWIGWHLHSNDPSEFEAVGKAYQHLLAGSGLYNWVPWHADGFFDDVEIVVDSWGTTALSHSGESLPVAQVDRLFNRKEGASVLSASWIALQHQRVTRAFYRLCSDNKSSPLVDPTAKNTLLSEIGGPGLFYGDLSGAYKRSAHAVRLWSRMVDEFSNKLQTSPRISIPDSNNRNLWVLAGTDAKSRRGILVSNPNPMSVSYWIQLVGSPSNPTGFKQVKVFQVDSVRDGKDGKKWKGESAFEISAHTVQLIVLTP